MFAKRTNWNLTTNRYSETLASLRAAGRELLDLTVSNPTDCGLPYPPDLLTCLNDPAALRYEPEPKGLLTAREAVTSYYAELSQPVNVSSEDIFLATGTSEAYSFALRLLCEPGDEVFVPHPGYPLFDFLASINDVTLHSYPLLYDHGWHIDFHSLRRRLTPRTKAIVTVHPNNPTGSFVKPEEVRELNSICTAHNIALISDEVFLDYAFETGGQSSLAANETALTFTLSGLSKISGLPQMKLAWCAVSGPERLKHEAVRRLEVIADTYLSLSAPVQRAAKDLLEFRHPFQSRLKTRLSFNLQELDSQLAMQKNCTRLRTEGGWYAVLRVPATRSDEELTLELMDKESVLVHPGHFFDFPQDGYLVLSLMTPGSAFKTGVERVLRYLNSYPS